MLRLLVTATIQGWRLFKEIQYTLPHVQSMKTSVNQGLPVDLSVAMCTRAVEHDEAAPSHVSYKIFSLGGVGEC